ncbi:uncharacterized protein [Parasteatoda tepidariorum]|uniref:uncharacterized protein n=1 Tax=Parasteatoda tepidariorum TaxID=114398 RepID=UPI0039BCF9AF
MEKLPIEWEKGSICLIFKKGDQPECPNYRGITLLNMAYIKSSPIFFLLRLQPFADKVVGNYQCGFRSQRSTIDQIHTLRQILEKKTKYNIKTFNLFINFKAAYDNIKRDKLYEAMSEFGIPVKLVNLTGATLNNCIRDSVLERRGSLWNRSLQVLANTDDIDIIGRSERDVKEAFRALAAAATNMSLAINEDKTKFIKFSSSTVKTVNF